MIQCGLCLNTGKVSGWDQDGNDVESECFNDACSYEENIKYLENTLEAFIHCPVDRDPDRECIGCQEDRHHVMDIISHVLQSYAEEVFGLYTPAEEKVSFHRG